MKTTTPGNSLLLTLLLMGTIFTAWFLPPMDLSAKGGEPPVEEQEVEKTVVVVTGASGHVGISVVEELLQDKSIIVRALYWPDGDRLQRLRQRLQAKVRTFHPKQLEVYKADMLDAASLPSLFAGASAVIHLAAVICLQKDEGERAYMERVNCEGTQHVLDTAHKVGIRSLLYFSSTHAYRHFSDRPLSTANGLLVEGDNYDGTKARAQRRVIDFAGKHADFKYLVLAPSGVIGRNDHPATEMWPLFERFQMVRFGPIPTGGYAFVDVRQVSSITRKALQLLLDPMTRDKIHGQEFLISGQFVTINRFVKTLQKVTRLGHCLNILCTNTPLRVPLRWLAAIAPYCETVAGWCGKKSLITSYSMNVLSSFPHGVAEVEKSKLQEFFAQKAQLFSLEETFRDRLAVQAEEEAFDDDDDAYDDEAYDDDAYDDDAKQEDSGDAGEEHEWEGDDEVASLTSRCD